MRALIHDHGHCRLEERPQPLPGLAEARIRVVLAGICRTDLEIVRGYQGFNGILGHEFIGVVESCADPAWLGQRVVGEINLPCGRCPTCRRGDGIHCPQRATMGIRGHQGALADFCLLPLVNLHRVPSGVSDRQAVFTEPLAAILALVERSPIAPGERVTVIGDGKLGLLAVMFLRLLGVDLTLIGHHPPHLELARSLGVTALLEQEISDTLVADLVVECSGSAGGFSLALRLVRPRGRIFLKSTFQGEFPCNLTPVAVNEISVIGSRCGPFAPALRLLQAGMAPVERLIDAVYPLAEGEAALQRAQSRGVLKVLVSP